MCGRVFIRIMIIAVEMIPVQSGEQQSAAAHAAAARHHSSVECVKKCLALTRQFFAHFQLFSVAEISSSRQKITLRVKQRTTKNSDNVRLNHENCVFGWNLGFFHVHEQQRYALLNVRVLSFREERGVFFTRFSRKLSYDCGPA